MPYKKIHLLILSFLFTPLLAFASAAGVPWYNYQHSPFSLWVFEAMENQQLQVNERTGEIFYRQDSCYQPLAAANATDDAPYFTEGGWNMACICGDADEVAFNRAGQPYCQGQTPPPITSFSWLTDACTGDGRLNWQCICGDDAVLSTDDGQNYCQGDTPPPPLGGVAVNGSIPSYADSFYQLNPQYLVS